MATAELLQQKVTLASDTERALYPLSVEQYHRMIEAGVLTSEDRCELLEGLLVMMSPIGPRHFTWTQLLQASLDPVIPTGWHIRPQGPITLAASEPQPDIAVVRGRREDHLDRHPVASEVGMVAEIADSTLRFDRNRKVAIYSAAQIPLYWIVSIRDRTVDVFSDPVVATDATPASYATQTTYSADDSVPVILDGREVGKIQVSDVVR